MLCTVTVDVDNTDGAIAFLNCINDLSYIDIKSIDVKGKSDGNDINLCDPCTNYGCEFQSGIVRTKCTFYMPPTEEAITKDQYEAKLKADMVAMLEDLDLQIDESAAYNLEVAKVQRLIRDKINALKEEKDG